MPTLHEMHFTQTCITIFFTVRIVLCLKNKSSFKGRGQFFNPLASLLCFKFLSLSKNDLPTGLNSINIQILPQ